MIRYHHVNFEPSRLLVSSKRNPRGYIVPATETRSLYQREGPHTVCLAYEVISGWRPMGFDGTAGRLFRTKADATEALLSSSDLWKGEFTDSVVPNTPSVRKVRQPKGTWFSKLAKAFWNPWG